MPCWETACTLYTASMVSSEWHERRRSAVLVGGLRRYWAGGREGKDKHEDLVASGINPCMLSADG
jgi:hypothetical protein